ncbi:MAG: NAD(P)H-dependent oxidoreductase [Flavobacteriales bacterium]|nr:NAD(P)H-dependent oxidoreductase [Flavobacteriales bacterium]
MITVISGTNRENSVSSKIAGIYVQMLGNEGCEAHLIDLRDLPREIAFSETYGERTADYEQIFLQAIAKTKKFIFVIPEYNGGFPGILKLFIDSIPPRLFHNKKAGLIGLSSGRGGAARAIDQMTNVLNYLQVDVIAQKPTLSLIEKALSSDGRIEEEEYTELLQEHAKKMIRI